MNKLTQTSTRAGFRRQAAVDAVGVDAAVAVGDPSATATVPRLTGYRAGPCIGCDFRTHATWGAGIGCRSAIHLDGTDGAVDKLVTDTDVFHCSVGDVNQGNQVYSEQAGIRNTCTRNPIRTEAEAIDGLGVRVSEEGERPHVPRFSVDSGVACCDTYVKGPES